MTGYRVRPATPADLPVLRLLIDAAIDRLQHGFLTPVQVAASRTIMGLDTQLVADGTFLVLEADGVVAGCGGWSRRATLYGGDHDADRRDPSLLDPRRDAARIRAMYTRPDFARRGIGRLILADCERAAFDAGFRVAELMATASGEPLYAASGYQAVESIRQEVGDVAIPLTRMRKRLEP